MWDQTKTTFLEAVDRVVQTVARLLPGPAGDAPAHPPLRRLAAVLASALVRRAGARLDVDRRLREWGMAAPAHAGPPRPDPLRGAPGGLGGGGHRLRGRPERPRVERHQRPGAPAPRLRPARPGGAGHPAVGVAGSRALERSVLIGAVNMGLHSARLLGLGARWLLLILATAMALEHLGVGGTILTVAFAILFGGIVLSLSLAVGLGARDLVARIARAALPGAAGEARRPRRATDPPPLGRAPMTGPGTQPTRRSGLLLHPTSLPGPFGIGDLGPGAHAFADFLAAAGQRSGRCSRSAPPATATPPTRRWAPSPATRCSSAPSCWPRTACSRRPSEARSAGRRPGRLRRAHPRREALLRHVADRFAGSASAGLRRELEAFRAGRAAGSPTSPSSWRSRPPTRARRGPPGTPELARRKPGAWPQAAASWRAEVEAQVVAQFLFDRQGGRCAPIATSAASRSWRPPHLRRPRQRRGVGRPDLFQLDRAARPWPWPASRPTTSRRPASSGGTRSTGGRTGSTPAPGSWPSGRRAALAWVDELRLDHFRGFEAYWSIPAGAPTAARAPGGPDRARRSSSGSSASSAASPSSPRTSASSRRPSRRCGTASASRAWPSCSSPSATDPQAPGFRPHRYERDLVAYTGTHDNDTVAGWWASGRADSTRTTAEVAAEKALARRYLDTDGRDMPWTLIRALQASVAGTVMAPVQDVLGLGSEARMNRPGTTSGNWRWRLRRGPAHRGAGGEAGRALRPVRQGLSGHPRLPCGSAPPAQPSRRSSNQ